MLQQSRKRKNIVMCMVEEGAVCRDAGTELERIMFISEESPVIRNCCLAAGLQKRNAQCTL